MAPRVGLPPRSLTASTMLARRHSLVRLDSRISSSTSFIHTTAIQYNYASSFMYNSNTTMRPGKNETHNDELMIDWLTVTTLYGCESGDRSRHPFFSTSTSTSDKIILGHIHRP